MADPLSEPVLYRLYLARQALEHGRRLVTDRLPYPRMQGVMALDDAVEWVTVTLLSHLGKRAKPERSLADYLDALVAARSGLGSHRPALLALRHVRNGVKHNGTVPDAEQARRGALEVESFVRAAVRDVFERELEEISLLALIADEKVKVCLGAAERALTAENYRDAVTEAARALALGKRNLSPAPRRERAQDAAVRLFRRFAGASGLAHESELRAFVASLEEPPRYLHLGIDLDELDRFDAIAPQVHVFESGDTQAYYRSVLPSKDEATFAVDFAARAILRFEDWQRRRR